MPNHVYNVAEGFSNSFSLQHANAFSHALHIFISNAALYTQQEHRERRYHAAAAAAFLGSYASSLATDVDTRSDAELRSSPDDELSIETHKVQHMIAAQLDHLTNVVDQLQFKFMLPALQHLSHLLDQCPERDYDTKDALIASIHTLHHIVATQRYCNDPKGAYNEPDGLKAERDRIKQECNDALLQMKQLADAARATLPDWSE